MTPLTTEEMAGILKNTSPNSFAFNVARLHERRSLPIKSQTEPGPYSVGGTNSSDVIESLRNSLYELVGFKSVSLKAHDLSDDTLTTAILLAMITINCRSIAMGIGIPLDDVQDAVIGSDLNGGDLARAVHTTLYGVKTSVHPYCNIQEDDDERSV